MGFKNIHVVDLDTIDVSNLNRQFLFREADVGQPKAVVAARFVEQRVPDCRVTPHVGRLEALPTSFYETFDVIISGLDAIPPRLWLNSLVHGLPSGRRPPLFSAGTEGFLGNVQAIKPGETACFVESIDLFPPPTVFQQCTLVNTPRIPEHCITYVSETEWREQHPEGPALDGDNPEHVQWVMERAIARARQFRISETGITFRLTQGVVKNIIPALATSNAIVSAMLVTEAFKFVTGATAGMEGFSTFNGSVGLYLFGFALERNPTCPVCGDGREFTIASGETLESFFARVAQDPAVEPSHPSSLPLAVSERVGIVFDPTDPQAAQTLARSVAECVDLPATLFLSYRGWNGSLRVVLQPSDCESMA